MICMNYDNNKKFGLLQFHLGYGKFYLNSPKGYKRKIINAQTGYRYFNFICQTDEFPLTREYMCFGMAPGVSGRMFSWSSERGVPLPLPASELPRSDSRSISSHSNHLCLNMDIQGLLF